MQNNASIAKPQLYIGIMSGTSVDGIDVVLAKITHNVTEFIAGDSIPFDDVLRKEILTLCNLGQSNLITLGQVEVKLAKRYAQAVNQLLKKQKISKAQIRAIGCHGQTVLHHPFGENPFSMQLVNANVLAAETGITCVTDFRGMDLAFQGQGAPLVPMFHQSLFKQLKLRNDMVLLNIGGIANLTIVNPARVIGFDTGPGNTLLDNWVQAKYNLPFDEDGRISTTGTISRPLLSLLMSDDYFSQVHPKSTGREYFNLAWLQRILKQVNFSLSNEDVLATLVQFTSDSIANELRNISATSLYVFGGGTQNKALMDSLKASLPQWQITITETIGIDSQYMESLAFAWLCYRCMTGQIANSTSVTGATQETILGQITQVSGHPLILGE